MMSDFLTESKNAIEELHDRIWTVIIKVMEDAGKPMADGLGIALHLVDMLPTIPIHFAFHSSTPVLTGFVPEVYTAWPKFRMDPLDFFHALPLQSNWKALDVLCEEIVKNVCGAEMTKAVDPTWLMTVSNVSTIGVKAIKVGAGDGPSSPHASHSPSWCSWTRSQSPRHHSQSSRSSSSSSCSGSRSGSASGSSSSGSSQSGSSTRSHAGSQAPSEGSGSSESGHSCSTSPDVVLVQVNDDDTAAGGEEDTGHSEDKEALSQGTVSLLDISTSDNEDAHKATVCEAACKSNIQYGNWWDEQIHQGKEGIAQCDKGVNDYADGGRPCKAPDKISPPFSYMEECGGVQTPGHYSEPIGSL